MSAQFKPQNGAQLTLSGFMAVNRNKLKLLTGDQLTDLVSTDEMELLYIHLQSMRNFNKMLNKVTGKSTDENETETKTEKME